MGASRSPRTARRKRCDKPVNRGARSGAPLNIGGNPLLSRSNPMFMKAINPFDRLRFVLPLVLGAVWLGAAAGCTQVLVSPETRGEYKLGELQVFVDRDFAAAHAAAKRGMKDAGLFEVRDDRLAIE